MAASLSDLLTTAQNIVTAINNAAQVYFNVNGVQSTADITAATLVRVGAGRIAVVSVTTAGSAVGHIYDANIASATTLPIYTIPTTAGVYVVNLPVTYGIVVAPGSGQHVTVSFS